MGGKTFGSFSSAAESRVPCSTSGSDLQHRLAKRLGLDLVREHAERPDEGRPAATIVASWRLMSATSFSFTRSLARGY